MTERYFSVCIHTNNGAGGGCMFSEETAEVAMAKAIESAGYYAVECGYLPSIDIEDRCSVCDGDGVVKRQTSRYRAKMVKCPACRGKESRRTVVNNVPFRFHSNLGEKFGGKLTGICDHAIASV